MKVSDKPAVTMLADLHPNIVDQLKKRRLFHCHVVHPECPFPPVAQCSGGPSGLAHLFCATHCEEFCAANRIECPALNQENN